MIKQSNNKTFFITESNYCDGRMLEYQHLYNYLIINGWQQVRKISQAQLVVIGTCALTNTQEELAVAYIKHCLKNKRKNALVIIAGCVSQICPDKLTHLGPLVIIPTGEMSRIDKYVEPRVPFQQILEPNIVFPSQVLHEELWVSCFAGRKRLKLVLSELSLSFDFTRRLFSGFKKLIVLTTLFKAKINPFIERGNKDYFYLRISNGCLGSCAYCGMKNSTGNLSSKNPETVLAEFSNGLKLGRNRFVITGEDTGCYGLDIATDFISLLKKMLLNSKEKDIKLIIVNLNAQWFVKYFKDFKSILVENAGKFSYLQIPIQSGSDKVLTAMNRPYRIGEVVDCLIEIRRIVPDLRIATDIIVGFPGEEKQDLKQTISLLQRINFDFVDIFAFEDRPGTLASNMHDKISPGEIEDRRISLLKVQNNRIKLSTLANRGLGAIKRLL